MDTGEVNRSLAALYANWKGSLRLPPDGFGTLGPPLLLQVTEAYSKASRRILFLGQETYGWEWNSQTKAKYPRYTEAWKYADLNDFDDFVREARSVEALCWAYEQFEFGARQPSLSRTPFWQAFAEVRAWADAALMWNNLVRMDYKSPLSIRRAPSDVYNAVIDQQCGLFTNELRLLDPHVCLFFTGPAYDPILEATLPRCEILSCSNLPQRELAQLRHPALPTRSFRTYHPRFLSQGKRWHLIETIRDLVTAA